MLVAAVLLVTVMIAIGMFYYVFGITEPEGLSRASWPSMFTDNFSSWMKNENGRLEIEETGLKRLDEYGLWIQVVDETGREVFCRNKPENRKTSYSASELISLRTDAYEQGTTVFVSSYEDSGKTWSYLVGFPYAIGKYMVYYNGENVERLFPVFRTGVLFLLCAVILLVIWYGFWLTGHLGKITKGIRDISQHAGISLPEKGVFREIYGALNKMDGEVRRSDQMQQRTEQMRREWIANITHDLKTPLSPIKGYAELLAENPVPDAKTIREYGEIILKNVSYTEKLMNDLKLTYQLDSGSIPFRMQKVCSVRFLKELVIDIVNDPAFCDRNIEFESGIQEFEIFLDTDLFRRAVNNLIINALTHNPPETKVTVSMDVSFPYHRKNTADVLEIRISDNGTGMSEEEQSKLFSRYYRGTNTKEKPEGSGLGLAIAKQIVTLHGGDITARSKPGQGMQFTILLPVQSPVSD